jgi:prephenate dehydrogenase
VSRVFERIAILGLGLLGGSVALAAREARIAKCLVGCGRRKAPLEYALAEGIVDEIGDVKTSVSGAELVVLAAPVGAMEGILAEAAPWLAPGALVTDVGSVKGALAESLPGLLPPGSHYVGAHPMAGSHLRGVEFAAADLFRGSRCVVTPLRSTPPEAVEVVSGFWRALGADIAIRDPGAHDVEVAWISHAPHALAFAFARALADAPALAGELAGSGFRDFVRIAHSDPSLWAEILNLNRKALALPLRAFADSLAELASAIEDGDIEAQEAFLAHAQTSLEKVTQNASSPATSGVREDARSGGDNPEIQADPESAYPRRVKNSS